MSTNNYNKEKRLLFKNNRRIQQYAFLLEKEKEKNGVSESVSIMIIRQNSVLG